MRWIRWLEVAAVRDCTPVAGRSSVLGHRIVDCDYLVRLDAQRGKESVNRRCLRDCVEHSQNWEVHAGCGGQPVVRQRLKSVVAEAAVRATWLDVEAAREVPAPDPKWRPDESAPEDEVDSVARQPLLVERTLKGKKTQD